MNGSHRPSGVLGVLSTLVPSSEREDWKKEWEGERGALDEHGPASLVARVRLLLAATEDAMRLSMRRIRPGQWGQDVLWVAKTPSGWGEGVTRGTMGDFRAAR